MKVADISGPTATTAEYKATKMDIWALGITTVIGGQYFSWNGGLAAGIGSNAVSILLLGSGYVCLVLSMAEMTSTLAFSGGAYGLSRCAIGYFAGWVIGCFEALEYIAYTSTAVIALGEMLLVAFPSIDPGYAPWLWLVTYALCNGILTCRDRVFWGFNRAIAYVSLSLVVVYVGGTLPFAQFSSTAPLVSGGAAEFFRRLPVAAWFFVGIEALSTVCNIVPAPKEIVPHGQIAGVVTLALSASLVFTATVGVAGSVPTLVSDVAILSRGYERMFDVAPPSAMLLSLPATFATIFGFVLASSNILAAMASSHLLPPVLATQAPPSRSHPYATLTASAAGFGLCFLVRAYDTLRAELFNIGMLFAFLAYTAQCIGYIYLKRRFQHLPRTFRSPVGIPGACYALGVWLVNIVAILSCQDNVAYKMQIITGFFGLLGVYYVGYAKHRQQMSEDERKVLFFAHVANANDARRKHNKSHSRPASSVDRFMSVLKETFASRRLSSSRPTVGKKVSVGPHPSTLPRPRPQASPVNSHIDDERGRYGTRTYEVCALGFVLAAGGLLHGWASPCSLEAQVTSFGIVATAFLCLALGMAEVSSALPFGGGVFGISRCAAGYFLGFCAGAFECLYYIMCASVTAVALGDALSPALGDDTFIPLLSLAAHSAVLAGHVLWGRHFWHITDFFAAYTCVLVVAYCAGTWQNPSQRLATTSTPPKSTIAADIVVSFPTYARSFVGIEALSSFADHVQRPIDIVPVGLAHCSWIVLLVSSVVFAASFSGPESGGLAAGLSFMVVCPHAAIGLEEAFGWSPTTAALVTAPIALSSLSSFVLAASNILTGLAKSRLVHRPLARPLLGYNCYPRTLVVAAALSWGIACLATASPLLKRNMFNLALLFGIPAYVAHCVGFIFLRRKFGRLRRSLRSPLGIAGSAYAIVVFVFLLCALLCSHDDAAFLAAVAVGTSGLLAVYYVRRVKRRQSLSEDERKIFFFAHDPELEIHPMQALRQATSSLHSADIGRYPATQMTIWALGLTLVVGGPCTGWTTTNVSISDRAIALALFSTAYLCLVLGMAEQTSALPFSGGVYGISRCSLGYYPGFLIGAAEALQYICYCSSLTLAFGEILHEAVGGLDAVYLPLVWVGVHGLVVGLHWHGGRLFWLCNYALATTSVTVLIVYVGGVLRHVDVGAVDVGAVSSSGFLTALPMHARFFIGVECISSFADSVAEPTGAIPRGQVRTMVSLVVLWGIVFVATVSIPSNIVLPAPVAFSTPGFALAFGLSASGASVLLLPAALGSIYGFVLCAANIVANLAKSKLIPRALGEPHKRYWTHPKALILASASSLSLCALSLGLPGLQRSLYNVALVYGMLVYAASCWAYVHLKRYFEHLKYPFRSPVGLAGTVFAMSVWTLTLLALLGFQDDSEFVAAVVAASIIILSGWYVAYSKHRQSLSPEEQRTLFFAHVAKLADAFTDYQTREWSATAQARQARTPIPRRWKPDEWIVPNEWCFPSKWPVTRARGQPSSDFQLSPRRIL
ncbi:Amino Acid-Polyamine-Organocation (APC) Family [Achlya hypogyna]|uniref:Amino Acid-Polyamine-Organocation (APC) Family n=1 Tax=Achlya hypogyna TaxID=1202772 RepID=A0A1V9Z8H7_ACHHY|nr:Amino Acid-Polyamine-Organocation (APC) Family [Achlya hypogyna]